MRCEVASLLKAAVDEPGLYLEAPAEIEAYARDWTGKFGGPTPLVVRPRSSEQLSRLLAVCNRHRIPVVPQGGNTGLVGGSVPRKGEVVVSLSRLDAIESFDPDGATVTVQAGVVLQTLQEYLGEKERAFAVDLAARGSCQIGGMIATNAGGNKVLRYGSMREQVRGLEVVLADGSLLANLSRLRKNNAGIDLKQLFVGSEGTLGVITRAVLQTEASPPALHTALAALDGLDALPRLLRYARDQLSGLSSLEFFLGEVLDLVRAHGAGAHDPFARPYPAYVLIEVESEPGESVRDRFLGVVMRALEQGLAADAVVAETVDQAHELWALRDGITEAISRAGLTHKFDVALPAGAIAPFMDRIRGLAAETEGLRAILFGHLGDGNIHVNMLQGPDLREKTFLAYAEPLAERIYAFVAEYEGSIGAEHGIGVLKRRYLGYSRTDAEVAMMRRLKRTLDPEGILNPGVIFES